MPRIRRLIRDLAGGNDEIFIGMLRAQLDCAIEAAALLREESGHERPEVLSERMREIEERSDHHRSMLVDELGVALTTPLDREDLFRLSRSVDDIVDNLHDFVEALARFPGVDVSACELPLAAVDGGLVALRAAVDSLALGPGEVTRKARAAKRAVQVREAYLDGLVRIFEGEDCVSMLKERELLRRLDVVGLRFGEAADALADAALKRA